MATEDRMNIHERYRYLRLMQPEYQAAGRAEQSVMLDTMEIVTGLDRKTLIRRLQSDLKRKPRQRQRDKTYGVAMDRALQVIAESYDYICAERLTPNLLSMAEHLAAHRELHLGDTLRAELRQVSVSTVKRHLQHLRQDDPRLLQPARHPVNEIAQLIPMKRLAWDERQPGHFEVDLVHHSGATSEGQYIHTLQMIDVATGWSERAAVLGRSALVMEDGFRRCQARLPFAALELHPDNGSEFLNGPLLAFWQNSLKIEQFSRSRPYHKNDNRFVEQKNRSLVRDYLGTERLDTVRQTNLLNEVYEQMWLYYNFFQPVLRLAEKVAVETEQGHVIHRRFDQPQTPFERLCASGRLTKDRQQMLERLREQTNPRQLRTEIYEGLDHLMSQAKAKPGKTENVYRTLLPAGRWSPLHTLLQPTSTQPQPIPPDRSTTRSRTVAQRSPLMVGR